MVISAKMRRASWIALAATTVLLAADGHASRAAVRAERAGNGDWIAYATAPATDRVRRAGIPGGSDIFIVQPRGRPRLVAGRGNGRVWNVCPAFSPNGKLLAFGQESPRGLSIRVVGVLPSGKIVERRVARIVSRARGSLARCPKWSADGKRIAYVDSGRKLVVMTIEGAIRSRRFKDPAITDFSRDESTLVSPNGVLIASRAQSAAGCDVLVSRRDGSDRRVMDDFPCSYAIAGWSPDSRKLLMMKTPDDAGFAIVAVPVNAPAKAVGVVTGVRVNHARSWPGYGDVSWQPKPKR